jgi:hypothetical protein
MKDSMFENLFDQFQTAFIVVFSTAIPIYFYIQHFRKANLFLRRLLSGLVWYGSFASVLVVLSSVVVFWFVSPEKQDELLMSYLTTRPSSKYRNRVLEGRNKDHFPKLRDVESEEEIMEILRDRELIGGMLKDLDGENVCVFAHHVIERDHDWGLEGEAENETMPRLIIMDKQFDFYNHFGRKVKSFMNFLRLDETFLAKYVINRWGLDRLHGPYYFLFDPQIVGGAVNATEQVRKITSVFKWGNSKDYKRFHLVVQVYGIGVFFYGGRMKVRPVFLTLVDKLAYCIQDFFRDIENYGSVVSSEESNLATPRIAGD